MKNLIYILLFLPGLLIAQTPQEFKYQAVVRDANGNLKVNSIISVKSSILSVSSSGSAVYSETQTLSTNGYGVVSLNIGAGTVVSGNFTTIDWGASNYYVKTELDISGGNNYQFMGTSQILSVPYALHSKTSATSLDDNDKSSINEIQQLSIANDTIKISSGGEVYLGSYLDNTDQQTLSLQGNQLVISNGNSVTLSGTIDLDADPTNELQLLSLTNDTLYLSSGNFVVIPPDNDADPNNELQVLSLSNDTLYLAQGNYVVLPPDSDGDPNNEIQTLSNTAGTLSISSGNSITLQDSSAINELQSLTLVGNDISITQGNTISLPSDADGDPNNELQSLSINNQSLSISNGNSVTIPSDADGDPNNELQNLSNTAGTIRISNGNTITLEDSSATNELQTLSYNNDTLSISNGNQVSISSSSFDFIFPDGKSGILPINIFCGDTNSTSQIIIASSSWSMVQHLFERQFTVPNGKNFYITSITCRRNGNSWPGSIEIDNQIIHNTFSSFTEQAVKYPDLSLPIIVSENQVVKLSPPIWYHSSGNIIGNLSLNGFLVDKKISSITTTISNNNSYTVPSSKILVILNAYSGGAYCKLNGKSYFLASGYNTYYSSSAGSSTLNRITSPIFLNENDVISSSGSIVINGYLMDK